MDMLYTPDLDWWSNHSDWRSNTLFGSLRLRKPKNKCPSRKHGCADWAGAPKSDTQGHAVRPWTQMHAHLWPNYIFFLVFRFSPIQSDSVWNGRNRPQISLIRSETDQNRPQINPIWAEIIVKKKKVKYFIKTHHFDNLL